MSLTLEILIWILFYVTSTRVRVTLIAPASLVTSASSSDYRDFFRRPGSLPRIPKDGRLKSASRVSLWTFSIPRIDEMTSVRPHNGAFLLSAFQTSQF
jgi:hypothetical protein